MPTRQLKLPWTTIPPLSLRRVPPLLHLFHLHRQHLGCQPHRRSPHPLGLRALSLCDHNHKLVVHVHVNAELVFRSRAPVAPRQSSALYPSALDFLPTPPLPCSDGTTNDASDESWRLALKALAEDGGRQCRGWPANESSDSSEPLKPPDNPAPRQTESLSVKLEGERRAALNCDIEPVKGKVDVLGAPEDDGDNWKQPMKLWTTSVCVSKSSEQQCWKCSSGRTKVDPGDPGHDMDASAVSESVKDVQKKPKKLQNTLEQVRERSKGRTWQNSPSSPGEEPEEPDDKAVVPGNPQNDPEGAKSISDEHVIKMNASCWDKGPRGHMGKLKRSRDKSNRNRSVFLDVKFPWWQVAWKRQ